MLLGKNLYWLHFVFPSRSLKFWFSYRALMINWTVSCFQKWIFGILIIVKMISDSIFFYLFLYWILEKVFKKLNGCTLSFCLHFAKGYYFWEQVALVVRWWRAICMTPNQLIPHWCSFKFNSDHRRSKCLL